MKYKQSMDDLQIDLNIQKMNRILAPIDYAVTPPVTVMPFSITKMLQGIPQKKRDGPDASQMRRQLLSMTTSLILLAVSTFGSMIAVSNWGRHSNYFPAAAVSSDRGAYQEDVSEPAISSEPAVSQENASAPASPQPTVKKNSYRDIYKALCVIREKQKTIAAEQFAGNSKAAGTGATQPAASPPTTGTGSMSGEERPTASAPQMADSDSSYGQTNVQVDGVDESDIVKNDGEYLYVLSDRYDSSSKSLVIVKAGADGKMALLSNTAVQIALGMDAEMYVNGNRLVVLEQTRSLVTYAAAGSAMIADYAMPQSTSPNRTKAVFYDISDKANPTVIKTYEQQGGYVSSRMTGNVLYLVTETGIGDLDGLTEKNVTEYVPQTYDSGSGKQSPMPAGSIQIIDDPGSAAYCVVSGFDLGNLSNRTSKAVLGTGGTVYATDQRLYVAGCRYGAAPDTEILRFSLDGYRVSYTDRGDVPGYVPGQYAMDESGGVLRVATQTYAAERGSQSSNVYTLDQNLQRMGSLEGLAPGETLKSVRFVDNMAYLVTFLQVDPLFAVDLSDPRKPALRGQLKIPGFSTYLHPIDRNTMISVGVAEGTSGTKLSLFDVSNPESPKELQSKIFNSHWSEAELNPKAFTYISDRGLLLLPFNIMEHGFQGLYAIQVSRDTGFTVLSAVTCLTPMQNVNSASLYDSHPGLAMKRGTYIGSSGFAVSNGGILSFSLDGLQKIDFVKWSYDLGNYTGYLTYVEGKIISPESN